jgi:hypothetical protein
MQDGEVRRRKDDVATLRKVPPSSSMDDCPNGGVGHSKLFGELCDAE